ncbi:MAG TPA: response regulator transcription factor [Nitrospiria bacterium]|nr:response regulator transcription factor [Nitrospiria bacterium]
MKRPRVLLADDHKIVVEGLTTLLSPHCDLVGAVQDGRALVEAVKRLKPDVAVVDISMPLLNGIDAALQLKKAKTPTRIIFLTMHPDVTYVTRALEAGASGFVLKHSASSELLTAIREAVKGRLYVTPMIAREVLQRIMQKPASVSGPSELTSRQREVLQLSAEGHSAKEIASLLKISPRTVEFHKLKLMEKLNLHSQAQLVLYAIKHGVIAS